MKKPPVDQYSWIISSLSNYISYVKCGVKPVSLIQINNRYLDECIQEIKDHNLLFITEETGKTHTNLFIFKDGMYEHIVSYLLWFSYNEEVFDAWLQGKVFGYSDEMIREFIVKNTGVS